MNKKAVISITILILTNLVCIAIIGFQNDTIKILRKNTISLAPGTSLPDLELAPVRRTASTESAETKRIKLIFVFKSPCSACNTNLNTWRKLARYFKDKIDIRGIILDGRIEAEKLIDEESLNFQLYVPGNLRSFREKMHIRLNMAQTILVSDNKVILARLGNLEFKDIEEIITRIQEGLKGT